MVKKNARKLRHEARTDEGKPRWIPSDEDFARAETLILEQNRGLSTVGQNVLAKFRQIYPACYGFYVLWQGEPNFRAYFFVEGRNAVVDFAHSDAYASLQDLLYNQLEAAGRGSRNEISVEFVVEDRSMYMAK